MMARKNFKKYEELWIKIRDLIRSITKYSDDYDHDEKYIKIKLDSENKLPLNKTMENPTITKAARVIFLKITNIIHKFS